MKSARPPRHFYSRPRKARQVPPSRSARPVEPEVIDPVVVEPEVIEPEVIEPVIVDEPEVIEPVIVDEPEVIEPVIVDEPEVIEPAPVVVDEPEKPLTWSPAMKKADLLAVAAALHLDVSEENTKVQILAALDATKS